MKTAFNLCFSNDDLSVAHLLNRIQSPAESSTNYPPIILQHRLLTFRFSSTPLNYVSPMPDQPRSIRNLFLYIPKPCIMKAISTFVSLFLIITTATASAVLYLNENYNISAALCIVWIVSLTLWIKTTGMNLLTEEKHEAQNA